MRTYEERARYILKQRDERLAKRRRVRTAVTMSAVSVCSLALIAGAGIAVNRLADRKGAVWISPTSASSGASGTADSQVTAPVVEKVYNPGDIHSTYKFTMPEFPDVDFSIDNGNIVADGKTLFGGRMLVAVYLADLNGDGYRELCTDWGVLAPSTPLDRGICALNFVKGEYYALSDSTGDNEYHLSLEDGKLEYKYYIVLKDQSVEKRENLALSDMKRVSDSYFRNNGQDLVVEKLYPRNNSDIENILEINDDFEFTIPEVPESSFKLVKGVLSCDGEFLLQGYPVHSIYLADLNGDGVREVCAEYSVGEGIVNMNIFAYDPVAKELYTLSDTGDKEYVLTFENGVLGYKHCVYGESGITTDEEGLLTLSRMRKFSGLCGLPKKDSTSSSPYLSFRF